MTTTATQPSPLASFYAQILDFTWPQIVAAGDHLVPAFKALNAARVTDNAAWLDAVDAAVEFARGSA